MIDVQIFSSFSDVLNYLETKRDNLLKALEVKVENNDVLNAVDGSFGELSETYRDEIEDIISDINSMLKKIRTSNDYIGIIILVEENGSPSRIYMIPGDLI
ncbi:MAG: hypothetical protein ACP5NY_06640 [Thermocladium sp.]